MPQALTSTVGEVGLESDAKFDEWVESIDSQRGIAWRCTDSLSLKKFLGYAPHAKTARSGKTGGVLPSW